MEEIKLLLLKEIRKVSTEMKAISDSSKMILNELQRFQ